MNTKIITVALIVFALIFVVLLAVMMGTVTNKMTTANTQLTNTLDTTTNASLSTYQTGTTVKGNIVISAINEDIKNISSNGSKIEIAVITGKKGETQTTKFYGYTTKGGENGSTNHTIDPYKYSQSDSAKPDYINPSAEFKCHQIANENGVIVQLIFDQNVAATHDDKVK